MRTIRTLVASLGVVALFSGVAGATDQVINLSATVPAFCMINGSSANATPASTPAAINQTIPIDATTFAVTTTAINVNIGNVICNKASTVQLTSTKGALLGPAMGGASATDFQNYINYSASVAAPVAASVAANLTTGTAAVTAGTAVNTSSATRSVAVQVTITPTANALTLIASDGTPYTDTLTVAIFPQ